MRVAPVPVLVPALVPALTPAPALALVPSAVPIVPIRHRLADHALKRVVSAVLLGAAALASPALAERADRDMPTNVESDRMHYDEPKQTTVFTGRVVLTKGTLIIRGDEMVLRQIADNQQIATATGKPATFRQKRDGPGEQYVNGHGQTIDYDSVNERMVLTGSAVMIRTECGRTMDQITGAKIVYDGRTETFNVDGKPAPAAGPAGGGRVRLTIQPRPDGKGSTPAPCPPGEPTRLQPDLGIPDPRPDAPGATGR